MPKFIHLTTTAEIDEANARVSETHYLGKAAYRPMFCYATPDLDAVAMFARPLAHHFKKRDAEGNYLLDALELTRLWRAESERDFSYLSSFLGPVLRHLRPQYDCILSYCDPKHHNGATYKATGFTALGPSRITDEYRDRATGEVLSSPECYRRYRTKSRTLLTGTEDYAGNLGKHGADDWWLYKGPGLELLPGEPKVLFCYPGRLTVEQVRKVVGGRYA